MSHIPSNAMPHAQAQPEHSQETSQSTWSRGVETVTGTVREYPKTAMAAGAVVAAGAIAAVAMPMMRGRGETSSGKSGGKSGNGKSKS